MHQKTKEIQNRFEGFLQTPCLWNGNAIYKLHQFQIKFNLLKINIEIDEKLRLGKYIERLVSFELQNNTSISILCENIQIQKEKRTLGELDCIILKDKKLIHLEIIYKFYLFDNSIGTTEIERFIGPNRKDSLVEKLTKLKQKQLPLLYTTECLAYLKTINLESEKIEQQVYFKAQLFVPFSNRNIQLKQLNAACIVGFYIDIKELELFKDCTFYIPIKKDWILIPHTNVGWLNFNQFKKQTNPILERKFSPLCWIKRQNGELQKFFLVWW
jgi:hypothetical protein